MFVKVYNQEGKEVDKAELPAEVFDVPMNKDLVHQVVVAQMANARQVLAHTKDRSEVRGGGVKPWRQKGTGRARHGSIRSPIWKGGGVTFGPTKERIFAKKINKKMKRLALLIILSSKARDKEMVLLDKLELAQAKTKQIMEVFNNLKTKIKKDLTKGTLVVLSACLDESKRASDQKIIRAIKNIPKIKTIRADSLNVLDVLSYRYLLMPQKAIEVIKKTYLK